MTNKIYSKIVILLGFVALGVGILSAYQRPATGFELSTYAHTPLLFWVCSCFAIAASVLIVFSTSDRRSRVLGGWLGGFAMTTIVAVPIVRGYHYLGDGDALSHFGTTMDINAGLMAMSQSRYPMVHTIGSVLHDATGLALPHVLLLVVLTFIIVFFVFVPLSVRELTGDTTTTYLGLFSGLLLLPLNHLSPSIYIHPTSQALMYAPAFLFVFFLLYRGRTWRLSLLFVTLAVFFVMLHPQQAANMVLFSLTIAVIQVGSHVYYGDGFARYREWILPEATVFAVAFWLWVQNLVAFWSSLESVYMIPFEETQAAETTATRSLSLTAVGGSLPEVFFKLFLVSLLFALLTVMLMVWQFPQSKRWLRSRIHSDTMTSDGGTVQTNVKYIFYGLFAVGALFIIYLVGGISDQYFRHLGMLMVFASILGAIALGQILTYLSARYSLPTGRRAIAVFFVLCLALSIPVVFTSPYIFYSSNHVTEMQMSGYETTFDHQSNEIAFEDIRSSTSRYGNAILGRDIPSEAYYQRDEPNVPDRFADRNLPAYYDGPAYLPVPESDRVRDPVLWRGFRFSHEDFAYLDTDPEINRVQSNGGYDLYLVND